MKQKEAEFPEAEQLREIERVVLLKSSTASGWITSMIWDQLRQGIGLAGIWTERSGC